MENIRNIHKIYTAIDEVFHEYGLKKTVANNIRVMKKLFLVKEEDFYVKDGNSIAGNSLEVEVLCFNMKKKVTDMFEEEGMLF